ncbi:hypothetical protein [Streptosporangium sp. NPDC002524]|uniref:hypothetical protein n=1 Tax=Streptosporangium sp. NPDC002524 TaxID=3154537 RepID=UPI003322BB15
MDTGVSDENAGRWVARMRVVRVRVVRVRVARVRVARVPVLLGAAVSIGVDRCRSPLGDLAV